MTDDQIPRELKRLLFMADSLRQQNDISGARGKFEQAIDLAQKAGLGREKSGALNSLGIMEKQAGNFANARQCFEECLRQPVRSGMDLALYNHTLVNLIALETAARRYGPVLVLATMSYHLSASLDYEDFVKNASNSAVEARARLGSDWLAVVTDQADYIKEKLRPLTERQVAVVGDIRVAIARWLLDKAREDGMAELVLEAEAYTNDLRAICEQAPDTIALKQLLSHGLRNAIVTQGRHGTLKHAEAHFARLQQLAHENPNDDDIQRQYASSLFSMSRYRLAADQMTDPAPLAMELRNLVNRFPDIVAFKELLSQMETASITEKNLSVNDPLVDLINRTFSEGADAPLAFNEILQVATQELTGKAPPRLLMTIEQMARAQPERRQKIEALGKLVKMFFDQVTGTAQLPEG